MGILSAYLSLFSQPLVPPPDAPDDLESSPSSQAHPHPHPKASASSSQEEYEPVELGTIPTRPGMLFRARSSFMKMVGATRDAEAAGLNAEGGAGAGGGGILGGSRERSGSTRSYGSTGITENGLGATERPNVGGRLESSREVHHVIGEEPEDDGKWMKQGDGVRL